MLSAGKYIATPIAHGVKDKDGAPYYVVVTFQVEGSNETINWSGFLNMSDKPEYEHPYKRTFDDLIGKLGFTGQDIDELAEDRPFALSKSPVEIVVEDKPYRGKDGKERPGSKVKYINKIGGKAGLSSAEMKKLPGFNFKAQILAAKQELGVKSEAKQTQPIADDDIPF